MNVSQLKPIIVALYNADITGMFWGAPGLGKSYSFRDAAKELKKQLGLTGPVLERHEVRAFIQSGGDIKTAFGMFDLRLSQCDPVDIGGLPRENKTNGTMERLPPSWFAHTLRNDLPDFGILLLDELPSAPASVQNAAYQITLDKVIDEYKLKDGWAVFGAGNRMTDGGVFFKMAMALANRMCHIDVESNLDSWVDWAIDNSIDHSLLAFIRFKPDLLNEFEAHVKDKRKGLAFSTERVWEKTNDFLANNSHVDGVTMQAILDGIVGPGPAAEYIGFRKVWQNMPDISQICIDPLSAPLPEDAATQYAVCTAMAAQCTHTNIPQMFAYVDRFTAAGRAELALLFVKDMQRRDGVNRAQNKPGYKSPVTTPEYAVWANKNKELFG